MNDLGKQILEAVFQRFGSRQDAESWYREEPLPGFSGKTANHLVREGRGKEVLLYIRAVDAGIHA